MEGDQVGLGPREGVQARRSERDRPSTRARVFIQTKELRMTFDHSAVGDVNVFTPKKNLVGREEIQELLGAIDAVAEKGAPKIVVDLGKINWVNSTGLGALVKARTTCANRKGWFGLARVGERISSILMVTKLVLVFDTFEKVEEAVAAAQKTQAA
jgi:anti-sigma B factor antagonist